MVLFALGRSLLAVVAVVNVALITGSLYLLTSPTEGGHGHDDHGDATDETVEASDSTV